MSKRTLTLIFALIVATTALVFVAVKQQPQNPPQKAETILPTPTPFAESTLSFSPNPLTVDNTATSSSINVDINTGSNNATAVQLEMQYDPKVLKNVDIALSSFLQNPVVLLKNIDKKTGRISFAFGINPAGNAQKGMGTVATLTFEVNKESQGTETAISFLPKTLVTAEGVSQSVLKSSTAARVILSAAPQ